MLKNITFKSLRLAHISLAFVGLMWVLPFLYYHHAYPLTTFYQEWGAAVLGLCAIPLLLTSRYWKDPYVPQIILLPIGMMALLMVQFLVGSIEHFDHVLLLSLYFLLTTLLMMLGRQLREELGLSTVATVLAVFLLVGAEVNTLAGLVQHYRWNTFLNQVVTAKSALSVYGNTAQPNHFANFIALGLLSLGLLFFKRLLKTWQTVLLALPLLFVLVLSGSRSAWLYLTFALALSWLWQRRDVTLRPLLVFSGVLWLGFAVMHLVVQIPWLEGATGSLTSMGRLFGAAGTSSIRQHLWHESTLIFLQFPLLGTGFGEFAYQHFLLGAQLQNPAIQGLYNNAHNIFFQTGAEVGLAGLLVLLSTLGFWIWQSVVRQSKIDVEHWWGFGLLAVIGIHSLLEYPLWYLYFISIAAITLGLFDKSAQRLELRLAGRVSVAVIALLGAMSLAQAYQGYKHLEASMLLRVAASKNVDLATVAHDELIAAYSYPLLSSYAEVFIANTMDPSVDHLKEKLIFNERALRYIPNAPVAYHQAIFFAWSDRAEEAKTILGNAIWAYPNEFQGAKEELEQLVKQDSARFLPLLEFATQKYEEYRRVAVSRK